MLNPFLEKRLFALPVQPVFIEVDLARLNQTIGSLLGMKLKIASSSPTFGFVALAPVSPEAIRAINSLPAVRMVHADQVHNIVQVPEDAAQWWPTSESRKVLEAESAFIEGYTGEMVKLGIGDTGVDALHPQLQGAEFYSEIAWPAREVLDENGHGSHVASTAAGKLYTSPANIFVEGVSHARLVCVKCLGRGIGTGFTSEIVNAIATAYNKGCQIISLSLGSQDGEPQGGPDNDPEWRIIRGLTARGVIFVIAAGNCLAAETPVLTNPDGPVAISSLKVGDKVLGLSPDIGLAKGVPKGSFSLKGQLEPHKVTAILPKGMAPVFNITTGHRSVLATSEHPFLSYNTQLLDNKTTHCFEYDLNWVLAKNIRVGTPLLVLRTLPAGSSYPLPANPWLKETTTDFMRIVGAYVGDGWYRIRERNTGELSFAIPQQDKSRAKYETLLRTLFGKVNPSKLTLSVYSGELAKFWDTLGFGKGALNKKLPSWVFRLPLDQRLALLEGYTDSDGHRRPGGRAPSGKMRGHATKCESPNLGLLQGLRTLAMTCGLLVSNIRSRQRSIKVNNGQRDYWYVRTFHMFNFGGRRAKAEGNNRRHGLPQLKNPFFGIEYVTEVVSIGNRPVYDIQVEGAHSFIADGFIVHNSGPGADTIGNPGSCPEAITVAAIDKTGQPASFSSRGGSKFPTKPDCAAPGVKIYSGTSRISPMGVEQPQAGYGFVAISGTSMATPHISGFIALLKHKFPNMTAERFKEVMAAKGYSFNNVTGRGVPRWSMFS